MQELSSMLNQLPTKQEKLKFILYASCRIVSKSVVKSLTRDGDEVQKMSVPGFNDIGYYYYSSLSRFTDMMKKSNFFKNDLRYKINDIDNIRNNVLVIDDKIVENLFRYIKFSIGNCGEMALLSAMFMSYFFQIFGEYNNNKVLLFLEKYKIHFGHLKNGDHAFVYLVDKKPFGKNDLIVVDPFLNTVLSEENFKKLLVKEIDNRFVRRNSVPNISFEIKLNRNSRKKMYEYCHKYGINLMLKQLYLEYKADLDFSNNKLFNKYSYGLI